MLCAQITLAAHAFPKPGVHRLRLGFEVVSGTSGLQSVEISMSSSALDVVLIRSQGEVAAEYLAAAQLLAARLQDRFTRRIVRVHDVAAPEPGVTTISPCPDRRERDP